MSLLLPVPLFLFLAAGFVLVALAAHDAHATPHHPPKVSPKMTNVDVDALVAMSAHFGAGNLSRAFNALQSKRSGEQSITRSRRQNECADRASANCAALSAHCGVDSVAEACPVTCDNCAAEGVCWDLGLSPFPPFSARGLSPGLPPGPARMDLPPPPPPPPPR